MNWTILGKRTASTQPTRLNHTRRDVRRCRSLHAEKTTFVIDRSDDTKHSSNIQEKLVNRNPAIGLYQENNSEQSVLVNYNIPSTSDTPLFSDEYELMFESNSQPITNRTVFPDQTEMLDELHEEDLFMNFNNQCDLSVEEIQKHIKHCRKAMRIIVKWDRMFSHLCLAGKVRFASANYDILCKALNTASNGSVALCTRKTITHGSQRNFLREHCFPKSTLLHIQKNRTRANRRVTQQFCTISGIKQDVRDCIRMVQVSEWAKLDLVTLPIYNAIWEQPKTSNNLTIEGCPLLSDSRKQYIAGCLWVQYGGTVVPTSIGDIVDIHCSQTTLYLPNFSPSDHGWFETQLEVPMETSEVRYTVKVGPSWCVTNKYSKEAIRKEIPTISEEEQFLMEHCAKASHTLNDISYLSEMNLDTQNIYRPSVTKRGRGHIGKGRPSATHRNQYTSNRTSFCKTDYRNLFLFPGDLCFILRPVLRPASSNSSSGIVCLMVASPIWQGNGRISERILWVDTSILKAHQGVGIGFHEKSVIKWGVVKSIPTVPEGKKPDSYLSCSNTHKNQGILKDGTRYYIYRFLLYSDGFKSKKSLSDTRSVEGCYIMPVGLPHHRRKSSLAARVITLGAQGQDINELLSHVIEDVVIGMTEGIDSIDPKGNRVKIFLDPLALMGDYPAVSAATDVMGHTADSFCSFCTIKKRKGGTHSTILFSNNLHCRRLSLTRYDERMKIIRKENPSDKIRRHLGMSCLTEEEASSLIALRLSSRLDQIKSEVQHNISGKQVIETQFDSHLSAAAVPDHIFKGLIQDVLTVCFNALSTDYARRRADKLICTSISGHNLPSIDSILILDKHGTFKGLHSLTTSALFCFLLFAAPVFQDVATELEAKKNDSIHPFHLPFHLQSIISLVYWWPTTTADRNTDINFVRGKNGSRPVHYYGAIQKLIESYLTKINSYIINRGTLGKVLDKPNGHRLLELIVHTIPIFKHALNISELVLEMVHRNFKDWLEKNSHHDAHLTAVELALSKDWGNRLYALYQIWESEVGDQKRFAEVGLRRLLLGSPALNLDPNLEEYQQLFSDFRLALRSTFRDPILDQLRGLSNNSMLQVDIEGWVTSDIKEIPRYAAQYNEGLEIIRSRDHSVGKHYQLDCYCSAKYFCMDSYSEKASAQPYNTIKESDCVMLWTDQADNLYIADTILEEEADVKKAFYMVLGIVASSNGSSWLVVTQALPCGNSKFKLDSSRRVQVLELQNSIRKVAKMHVCNIHCKLNTVTNSITHYHDTNVYYLYDKRNGFPPHLG